MNEKRERVFCGECGHEMEKIQEESDSSYYECNNPDCTISIQEIGLKSIICENCDEEITGGDHIAIDHNMHKFCSVACALEFSNENKISNIVYSGDYDKKLLELLKEMK